MWEGNYGKEPFDLRLVVLRLVRNLDKLFALTVVGTLLFGGGYYVKNVLLRGETQYSATSTYKVTYVEDPNESGDYYINEASWNTFVDSAEFLTAVQEQAEKAKAEMVREMSHEELREAISAKLPSDWHVPTTTVITNQPEKTMVLGAAVEAAMIDEFVENSAEVQAIKVIDPAVAAQEVVPDVRPMRACVLSAVLSGFFAVILFLLKEIGDDSIWLPATLKRRYGLPVLGTPESPELLENMSYLLKDRKRVAVCSADRNVDVMKVAQRLQELEKADREWLPVPAPLICTESCELLREAEGVLLVVKAGSHVGKPLEYVLEFLGQQDCDVTAALLWETDEALLRTYYRFPTEGK